MESQLWFFVHNLIFISPLFSCRVSGEEGTFLAQIGRERQLHLCYTCVHFSWRNNTGGLMTNIFAFVGTMGGIILLDIFLSGDNVLVIGAAAAGLTRRLRWYAIAAGGALAMALRILFTTLASFLLNVPFIQTLGAVILLYLAQKLLRERTSISIDEAAQPGGFTLPGTRVHLTHFNDAFVSALLTILVADVTMSLDNIIAVGALANGEILPLVVGLVGSITILMLGSAVVSVLIERFRWILDIAALILGWTSATMIHDDLTLLARSQHLVFLLALGQPTLPLGLSWLLIVLAGGTVGFIIFFNLFYRLRDHHITLSSESKDRPFK